MTSITMMNSTARGLCQGLSSGVRPQHVIVSILFALAMLTPWAVIAADAPRIAVVQTERILREAAPAKAAQTKLEQEFGKRDKELQELGAKLKAAGERLERDATVMAESERARRQREAADLDKEFQRRQREFREDLNQRRNEEIGRAHV